MRIQPFNQPKRENETYKKMATKKRNLLSLQINFPAGQNELITKMRLRPAVAFVVAAVISPPPIVATVAPTLALANLLLWL